MTLEMGYLPTNIAAINDLLGGLPVGSGTLFYGPPEAGKTILEEQCAFEVLQTGHNAVIIDTEGSDHTYADWHDKFNKRYALEGQESLNAGLHFVKVVHTPVSQKSGSDHSIFKFFYDKEEVKKHPVNIFIFSIREITEILAFFGKPVLIEPSEGGKFKVSPQPGWKMNPVLSALGQFMQQNNVGYLAVDSLTNPTKQLGTEQQNLPARAQVIGYLMTSIQGLTEKQSLVTVMVSHEGKTGNTNPFEKFKRPQPLGGDTVMYNVKYAVYMSHEPGPRTPETVKYKAPTREFWVSRHPSREPWTRYAFLTLGAQGFLDS